MGQVSAIEHITAAPADGKDSVLITLTPEQSSFKSSKPVSITVFCHKQVGGGIPVSCDEYYLAWINNFEACIQTRRASSIVVVPDDARRDNDVVIIRAYSSYEDSQAWNSKYIAMTSIAEIEDGKDAVSYYLRTSIEVVNCDASGAPKINTFEVSVHKTVGNGTPVLCTSGTYLKAICTPSSGLPSIFKSEKGKMDVRTLAGGLVPAYFKTFEITAGSTPDGNDIGEKLILTTVDGIMGPAGNRGQLPYPMSAWDASVTYTATNNVTPFVLYEPGKTYYVMNKTGSCKGINPASDYATNGKNATWVPFENYKAIFTELLMANLGIIAGSVFWDNKLFSQYGTDKNGNAITSEGAYKGIVDGSFIPNLLIDWLTGKLKCNNVDITGTVNATDGKFKGSIAENCKPIPTGGREPIKLDFSTGFNFSGTVGNIDSILILPSDIKYEGVRCSITNLGARGSNGNYILQIDDNSTFHLNGYEEPLLIDLGGSGMIELKAIAVNTSKVTWWVLNSDSFSYRTDNTAYFSRPYLLEKGWGGVSYTDGRGWYVSGRSRNGFFNLDKLSVGRFKISFTSPGDVYSIMVTCNDVNTSGYGCVKENTTDYFIVETIQGNILKDIGFNFIMF